jgi:hypothetical protein
VGTSIGVAPFVDTSDDVKASEGVGKKSAVPLAFIRSMVFHTWRCCDACPSLSFSQAHLSSFCLAAV